MVGWWGRVEVEVSRWTPPSPPPPLIHRPMAAVQTVARPRWWVKECEWRKNWDGCWSNSGWRHFHFQSHWSAWELKCLELSTVSQAMDSKPQITLTYWWCGGTDRPYWPLLLWLDGLALSQEIFILSWYYVVASRHRRVESTGMVGLAGLKQSTIGLGGASSRRGIHHSRRGGVLKLSLDTSEMMVLYLSILRWVLLLL